MKQKEFKVGDKVFDITWGWGFIRKINEHYAFPLDVEFDECIGEYLLDGRRDPSHLISLSHTEYGPHIQSQPVFPKEMEVSEDGKHWYKKVILSIFNNKAIAIAETFTLEALNHLGGNTVIIWSYYRELPEETITELTLEQVAEKVGIPAHLLRIKK